MRAPRCDVPSMSPCERAVSRRIPETARRTGRGYEGRGGGGLGGVSLSPEETLLNATAPKYQFRADTVVLDGSNNVASIPNRKGVDSLVMTSGTLAGPAGDILFGGAPSLNFTASQWLDSNLGAAAWAFINEGIGFEIFTVFALPNAALQMSICGTAASTSTSSKGFRLGTFGGNLSMICGNGSVGFVNRLAGVPASNTAYYQNGYIKAGAPLEASSALNATVGASGAFVGGAPVAGSPVGPFRLGCDASGATPATMKWCETLIFDRVLSEYDRQLVREYIAARYGIAAPLLAGADRDIIALVPFSYLDPAYYATAAGKVAAFLDRARPGHSFAQGTNTRQVVNPTADASLNGALSAVFDGVDDWYASNLPAAKWSYLHKAGQTTYFIWTPSTITPTRAGYTTHAGGAPSVRFYPILDGSGNQQILLANNAGSTLTTLNGPPGPAGGVAEIHRITSAPATLTIHRGGVQTASTAATYATGDATGTLAIGTVFSTVSANPFLGALGGFVSFDRELNATELAAFSAAAQQKWGKAA